jgi:hypothetical protein
MLGERGTVGGGGVVQCGTDGEAEQVADSAYVAVGGGDLVQNAVFSHGLSV